MALLKLSKSKFSAHQAETKGDVPTSLISTILYTLFTQVKKLAKEHYPRIVFSIGHKRNSDPGAVNTHTADGTESFYADEISANESFLYKVISIFEAKGRDIYAISFDSLLDILRGALALFNITPPSVLVQLHHDMSVDPTHKGYNRKFVTLYYGSNKGFKFCSDLALLINSNDKEIEVRILSHTESFRKSLGFIKRTFNTAIIIDGPFISNNKTMIDGIHEAVGQALLALNDRNDE